MAVTLLVSMMAQERRIARAMRTRPRHHRLCRDVEKQAFSTTMTSLLEIAVADDEELSSTTMTLYHHRYRYRPETVVAVGQDQCRPQQRSHPPS